MSCLWNVESAMHQQLAVRQGMGIPWAGDAEEEAPLDTRRTLSHDSQTCKQRTQLYSCPDKQSWGLV